MATRPVHRIKHVVDFSATLTAGSTLTQNVIVSVDAPVLASTTQVETASKVYGIYLKVEVASNEAQDVGAIPNVYLGVYKNPGANTTAPIMNAVGSSDNKRFMIHQEMVMIDNKLGGNPRILFNGVIKIPKGYARFGPGDLLQVFVFATALNIAVCGQVHYKEFR